MTNPSSNYQTIWETVRQIPKGKVATYREIAEQSGLVGQARLVGYALHNLPRGTDVPWYRVVSSHGKISLPRKGGHYHRQRRLLLKEGVTFKGERIDLTKFGWLRQLLYYRHSS